MSLVLSSPPTQHRRLEAAGTTHPGRRRERNEDCFAVVPAIGFFAVADGVGSGPDGDLASKLALDMVSMLLADDVPRPDEAESTVGTLRARLVGAVTLANQSIHATGARHRGPGMATTFAGVLVERDCFCVVHLGDSRVYRLRDGALEALTEDHNVANELMWRGAPPELVRERRDRGHLSRALGSTPNPELAVRIESARPRDLLLLSTDGLHRVVPEDEIASILREAERVEAAVESLIRRANERGGPDNVTAVVVRWAELGSPPHGGARE